jgi:hypothetical protein
MKPIGGILAYTAKGSNRPCGQTVGADGAGDFAIVIYGTHEQAEAEVRKRVRAMEQNGLRFEKFIFVPNDPDGCYFGNPLSFIDATKR